MGGGWGGVRPLKTSPRPTELEPLAWNDNGERGAGGGGGLGISKRMELARLVLIIAMGSLVRCPLWIPVAHSETRNLRMLNFIIEVATIVLKGKNMKRFRDLENLSKSYRVYAYIFNRNFLWFNKKDKKCGLIIR